MTILSVAIVAKLSVEALFVAVLAPLLPTVILATRQIVEQLEAAARLEVLRAHAEKLWNEILSAPDAPRWDTKLRILQDEIFDARKRSPPVFDWIFRRLRADYDLQMKHGAQVLAEEARRRIGIA